MAAMLARIHRQGARGCEAVTKEMRGWSVADSFEQIGAVRDVIDQTYHQTGLDEQVLNTLAHKKDLIEGNDTDFADLALRSDHVIHGDYLDHNLFFDKRKQVQWVFDLEKVQYAPRAFELIRSLVYSIIGTGLSNATADAIQTYISSYHETYPLSRDEITEGLRLFYLKTIHSVWSESEYYIEGNERVREFLTQDQARLRILTQQYDELETLLRESV